MMYVPPASPNNIVGFWHEEDYRGALDVLSPPLICFFFGFPTSEELPHGWSSKWRQLVSLKGESRGQKGWFRFDWLFFFD